MTECFHCGSRHHETRDCRLHRYGREPQLVRGKRGERPQLTKRGGSSLQRRTR